MPLVFVDHVYWANAAGELILLDVRRSRYFAVPKSILELLADQDSSRVTPESAEHLDTLINAGVLVDRSSAGNRTTSVNFKTPTTVWRMARPNSTFSLSTVLIALGLQVDTQLRLRFQSLMATSVSFAPRSSERSGGETLTKRLSSASELFSFSGPTLSWRRRTGA